MKNLDTPPNPDGLVRVTFTTAIPDTSWYRHRSWAYGEMKRFRHYMTLSSNIDGFEFFNDPKDVAELERAGRLDPQYHSEVAKALRAEVVA